MTVHIVRNITAWAAPDSFPMLIQAVDIDHPPGIGMAPDIEFALWIV
jgi:hypothetical protein